MFGEFSFEGRDTFAAILIVANLALILVSLAAMAYVALRARGADKFARLGLLWIWLTQMVSFILFNLKYPMGCTMDFRYIVPTVFTGAAFLGIALDRVIAKPGVWRKVLYWAGAAAGRFSRGVPCLCCVGQSFCDFPIKYLCSCALGHISSPANKSKRRSMRTGEDQKYCNRGTVDTAKPRWWIRWASIGHIRANEAVRERLMTAKFGAGASVSQFYQNTATQYKGVKINIVDTPGHAIRRRGGAGAHDGGYVPAAVDALRAVASDAFCA